MSWTFQSKFKWIKELFIGEKAFIFSVQISIVFFGAHGVKSNTVPLMHPTCHDLYVAWWRHQMETFSASLAICPGNSPVLVTSPHKGQWRGALISAWINGGVNNCEAGDLRRWSKQSWGWWFETQSRPLWRHYNVLSHTTHQAKLTLVACNFTRRFPTPSIDQGPLLTWINCNHSIHKQLHPL